MPRPLPDPVWAPSLICVRCGYNLTGLAAPGRCPECGGSFHERQLILCGVPRRKGTSSGRRWAWVGVFVAAGIFSQIWPIFIFFSWIIGAMFAAALLIATVALLVTSPRERGGAERFVISPLGIARLPLSDPGGSALLDSHIVPWPPDARVELKRISPVWYRIRIGSNHGERMGTVVLDAGIRCPTDAVPDVRAAINTQIAAARDLDLSPSANSTLVQAHPVSRPLTGPDTTG